MGTVNNVPFGLETVATSVFRLVPELDATVGYSSTPVLMRRVAPVARSSAKSAVAVLSAVMAVYSSVSSSSGVGYPTLAS